MKRRKDGRFLKVMMIDKEKVYFYSTAKTEKEALKDFEIQLLQYHEKKRKGKTFEAIALKWCEEYREKISDINFRKNPKATFERILTHFKDVENIEYLTARDINIFLNKLIKQGYYKKTIATHKSMLNMICSYAVLNGYTKYNPVSDVKLPNNLPKTTRKIPLTEDIKEIGKHHSGFDLLPFFLLYTGCRKSEALAVRYEDIDYKNKTIKIHSHIIHDGNKPKYENVLKTDNAERTIIILDRLFEVLPKKKSGFLFSMNDDGIEPLTKRAYDKRLEAYCKKYDVSFTAHQLRHAYATMLFEADIDVKDAQALMGHSDINLTRQVYTHIRSERKEETINKLNNFNF